MTTKFHDNKIREISKFYCHGISQEKQRFGTIFRNFSLSPTPPPPKKNTNFVNFVVSASLILNRKSP